jgi:hypothetical protein
MASETGSRRRQIVTVIKDFLLFPGSARVGEAPRAYVERGGQWRSLLVAEAGGQFSICSFGSLLPYLTGRTDHIVHNIGECPICFGMDPLLWTETDALVEEALADEAACSRRLSHLPMAQLQVIDAPCEEPQPYGLWRMKHGDEPIGLRQDGVLCGIEVLVYRGEPAGPPSF